MNIERANKVLSQLKQLHEEQFYMSSWIIHPEDVAFDDAVEDIQYRMNTEPCGTVACGAGWISLLNGGPTEETNYLGPTTMEFAKEYLELDESDAYILFYGCWANKPLEYVTLSEFTEVFEKLITEGYIDLYRGEEEETL